MSEGERQDWRVLVFPQLLLLTGIVLGMLCLEHWFAVVHEPHCHHNFIVYWGARLL